MNGDSPERGIPLSSKMRVSCATTSHDVEEGECPWCTIERLKRERDEKWGGVRELALQRNAAFAERDRLTVERNQLIAAIGEHVTVRSDQYAQIQRLRAALERIKRIGPLGVDTYPECYRRMRAIAEEALSGEPNSAPETRDESARGRWEALTEVAAWVDSRVEAEVTHRPDVNIYKRTLANTWGQMQRKLAELLAGEAPKKPTADWTPPPSAPKATAFSGTPSSGMGCIVCGRLFFQGQPTCNCNGPQLSQNGDDRQS